MRSLMLLLRLAKPPLLPTPFLNEAIGVAAPEKDDDDDDNDDDDDGAALVSISSICTSLGRGSALATGGKGDTMQVGFVEVEAATVFVWQ